MSQCSVHDNYFAKLQSLWTTVCGIRCQLRKSFHILAVLHSQKLKTESWKQRCRIDKCIHSLLLKCFINLLGKGQSELMSTSEQQMSLSWRRRRFDNVMVVINEERSCSFALAVPSSCCRWPAAARAAPWSECFCGDAGPRWYGALPELSRTACSLKSWQLKVVQSKKIKIKIIILYYKTILQIRVLQVLVQNNG